MQLPLFKTDDKDLSLVQIKWKSILDPVLANPLVQGLLLKNIQLPIGDTVINHKLGRVLQGWMLARVRTQVPLVYDKQDTNQTPELTLILHAGAVSNVDIWVF